jgi:MHS family proline/betaine transporter-like MFS transporter
MTAISARRAVLAAALGNTLEWFDLIVYAVFAAAIGRTFFPAADPAVSLLVSFGTFGVAFFMRPLGGIVLGSYADRRGRKAALIATTTLMMIGTGLIAVTPSYATIGVLAPALVIAGRLIQGFSAGGEFGAATTFLAEQTKEKKTFFTSWQFASQGLAMALGSLFGFLLPLAMSPADLDAWGWRLAFAFGLLIGPVTLYIRRRIAETDEFLGAVQTETVERRPLASAFKTQTTNMALAVAIIVVATVSIYMFLYMPAYAATHLGLTASAGAAASFAASIAMLTVGPLAGYFADRIGRVRLALASAGATAILPIPLYAWLITNASPLGLIAVQGTLAIVISVYLGVLPAILADLFPVRTRTTAISLSYNVAVMAFGGFAPFVITWLIASTGWRAAPSYYVGATAMVAVAALAALMRRGLR